MTLRELSFTAFVLFATATGYIATSVGFVVTRWIGVDDFWAMPAGIALALGVFFALDRP